MRSLPRKISAALVVLDALWGVAILGGSALTNLQSAAFISSAIVVLSDIMTWWNAIHFPVHLFLEPVFFASTMNSPNAPSILAVASYLFCGVLWVAFVGWVLGWFLVWCNIFIESQ